jgi:protein-export membrane protein SecD
MSNHYRWLAAVVLIAAFCLWVSLPNTEGLQIDLNNDGQSEFGFNATQSLGLDLVGGLRVLLEAELPPEAYTTAELRETANSVSRRVNGLGLTEATVQVQGNTRILVELPGVTDPEQAIDTVQQTALLEFVDFGGLRRDEVDRLIGQRILTNEQATINEQRRTVALEAGNEEEAEAIAQLQAQRAVNPRTGQPFETVMTGAGLGAARANLDPQTGQYLIEFDLSSEGREVFGPYTGQRIGQPMAIVLDGEVLSAPTIQARLDDGGVITGNFTEDEAQQLALQLRSGSLAIPLSVESAEQVGATLGQRSVESSIRAGAVGVIVVLAFMLLYYRIPGIAADLALIVFILLNLALFKLIPITLTLPAITGFLISIGTAVDGNILIFERLKEELRDGKSLFDALDAGFDRAWTSIRDSNLSTIIICGVLFLFGQTPGASIVSGFALTLALGLVLNLFTAVIVTRTFLYIIASILEQPLSQRKWLVGA